MLAYPSLVKIKNKLFMFYNGNGYGRDGIALAKSTIKKYRVLAVFLARGGSKRIKKKI